MNTEITLKGIPLIRSGYSSRGFASAGLILAVYHNSSNKTINVKYMGCHIGYISHIHYGDLPDGGVELRGDISFPLSNLIAHREILNNKDVYPTCIIETASGANEARLSEVILFTEEDREFDEQQPLDLSGLRHLVHGITGHERDTKQDLTINITVDDSEISEEERQKILSDIKRLAGQPEITFDEKGRYDGEGFMRYGHYRNGALMGYVTVRASTWGADFNSQDLPDILEKFIEHQRKKWGEATNRWSFDEA
ncbi:hypothetical protein AXA88_23155 [Salmonella enterica]|nr:hypothetical protein [Salmonella enterica]EAX3608758.1 hypothetical protein [Salmonella enterica]EGW6278540.1 hypothetical protein [Salmonella enterica]